MDDVYDVLTHPENHTIFSPPKVCLAPSRRRIASCYCCMQQITAVLLHSLALWKAFTASSAHGMSCVAAVCTGSMPNA